ncbi:MAG: hypothetical protein U0520_05380 [Candidatus Saccharimonadales bacterium]
MAAPTDDACAGIVAAGGDCDASAATTGFNGIIATIINVLSVIVGAVSVIFIIVGGFRYVISNGDSNGMAGAKNTILYAIVGLVIVLFAQVLVAFVFTKAKDATTGGAGTNTTTNGGNGSTNSNGGSTTGNTNNGNSNGSGSPGGN